MAIKHDMRHGLLGAMPVLENPCDVERELSGHVHVFLEVLVLRPEAVLAVTHDNESARVRVGA